MFQPDASKDRMAAAERRVSASLCHSGEQLRGPVGMIPLSWEPHCLAGKGSARTQGTSTVEGEHFLLRVRTAKGQLLSRVLFCDPWTVACQAPCPWESPGKNTGVGSHPLLQGIFQT